MTARERLVGRLVLRKLPEDVATDIADRSYAEIVQEIIQTVQDGLSDVERPSRQDVIDLLCSLAGPETRAAMLPAVPPAQAEASAAISGEPRCLHIHAGPYRCHSDEQCPERWVGKSGRTPAAGVLLAAVRKYGTAQKPAFLVRRGSRCGLIIHTTRDGYTYHRSFAWATVETAQQHGAIQLGPIEAAPGYQQGGSHWGYRAQDIGYAVHEIAARDDDSF